MTLARRRKLPIANRLESVRKVQLDRERIETAARIIGGQMMQRRNANMDENLDGRPGGDACRSDFERRGDRLALRWIGRPGCRRRRIAAAGGRGRWRRGGRVRRCRLRRLGSRLVSRQPNGEQARTKTSHISGAEPRNFCPFDAPLSPRFSSLPGRRERAYSLTPWFGPVSSARTRAGRPVGRKFPLLQSPRRHPILNRSPRQSRSGRRFNSPIASFPTRGRR